MLKKENRLKKVAGTKGKVIETPLFNIKISKSGEKVSRFGFVVSKKVSKKAVLRNKTKRVLAQSARELLKSLGEGKNVIVYAKKLLTFKQLEEVKKSLQEALK